MPSGCLFDFNIRFIKALDRIHLFTSHLFQFIKQKGFPTVLPPPSGWSVLQFVRGHLGKKKKKHIHMFSQKVMFVPNPKNTMQRLAGDYVSMGNLCRHTVTVRLHTLVMFHQHNQRFIPVKLDCSLGSEMLRKLPVDTSQLVF